MLMPDNAAGLQNEEITRQCGTQHVWGLDVGRSQAVCPRTFLPLAAGVYITVVEQGQEERCSGGAGTREKVLWWSRDKRKGALAAPQLQQLLT